MDHRFSTDHYSSTFSALGATLFDVLRPLDMADLERTMMKDKDDYRNAWKWHIDQLAKLALAAGVDYPEYIRVQKTLRDWLESAITYIGDIHE